MAKDQSGPVFQLTAGATFAKADLYKFVAVNSTGHAVTSGPTTASGNIAGTLWSVTNTTSGAGSEAVSVRDLTGKFPVRMAASTRAAGQTIAASSVGFGIAPTTDQAALAIAVEGTSGGVGRIHYAVAIAASAADI